MGFTYEIPVRTESTMNLREHWRVKSERAKKHRRIASVVSSVVPWSDGPLEILLTRISPREMDSDNLAASMKSVRDGIADAIGRDDGSKSLKWVYSQERGRPKEYSVRVSVT